MSAIDIRNLIFRYGNNKVFNRLNLKISKGAFVTILGKGGIGKTTLFKILSGNLKYSGNIFIMNKSIKYGINKGYIGLISPNLDYFTKKTVLDELVYALQKKGVTNDKISSEIERVIKKTLIHDILNFSIKDLLPKEKILLQLTIQFLNRPSVLIIDDCLSYLDQEKRVVVNNLHRLNKKTTIVNITNNVSECTIGRETIILNKKIWYGKNYDLTEEVFLENDLEVPFMISLSSKLNFYNITQNSFINMEKLVDSLWQ